MEGSRIDSEILKLTRQLEQILSDKEKAQTRIKELELQLWKKDKALAEIKGNSNLKWSKGKRAPREISNNYIGEMSAAVDGNLVYVMASTQIYAYNASTRAWSQHPDSSFDGCALAIVNNLLTLIGGRNYILTKPTSYLVSPRKEKLPNGRKNSHPCRLNEMERVHSAQKRC